MFVTNIPREAAGPEDLYKLYGLRWHVELVFKALKSKGCLRSLTAHASNPHHLEVLLLAQLLQLVQLVLNLKLWRIISPREKGAPRLEPTENRRFHARNTRRTLARKPMRQAVGKTPANAAPTVSLRQKKKTPPSR